MFQDVFQEVFPKLFQELFQYVFQEIIRDVFRKAFRKIGWLQTTFAKVVGLVSLGIFVGPGTPDPDLDRLQIRVWDTGRH